LGPGARQDDSELVSAVVAGRSDAFDLLVDRYHGRIYGVIHRMVGDREKAMDLTQETFLKAWKGLAGFGGQSSFYTWLYRIARNAVMSQGRYESARPKIRVSLDESDGSGDDTPRRIDPEDKGDLPTDSLLAEEQKLLVTSAIEDLPSEFREIIVLRDMEDCSYEEIAELLDIPIGTVRSRLHRARMELKERLKKVLDPAG